MMLHHLASLKTGLELPTRLHMHTLLNLFAVSLMIQHQLLLQKSSVVMRLNTGDNKVTKFWCQRFCPSGNPCAPKFPAKNSRQKFVPKIGPLHCHLFLNVVF
jgi:hypothetical protein